MSFRDNYWELINAGFNVQIPTCEQIEKEKQKILIKESQTKKIKTKQPLTTIQNSQSRMVTKVIFQINNFFIFTLFPYLQAQ